MNDFNRLSFYRFKAILNDTLTLYLILLYCHI